MNNGKGIGGVSPVWKDKLGLGAALTFTDIIFADLFSAVLASAATPGFYRITDRGDIGIIVFVDQANNVNAVADGGFLDNEWGNPIWFSGDTVSIGDVRCWQDAGIGYPWFMWENLTGNNGSNPDGDSTNWLKIPKVLGNGYVPTWNPIIYDFLGDTIIERLDPVNFCRIERTTITSFPWGNPAFTDTEWGPSGVIVIQATNPGFNRVKMGTGCAFVGTGGVIGISNIQGSHGSAIQLTDSEVDAMEMGVNTSFISVGAFSHQFVFMETNSSINTTCLINRISLSTAAALVTTNPAATVEDVSVGINSTLTADNDVFVLSIGNRSTVDTNGQTINNSHIGDRLIVTLVNFLFNDTVEYSYSTAYATLNASGAFAGGVLTIPANHTYLGRIELTNAAGGNIETITGGMSTSRPVTFYCSNGITNTFQPTPAASAAGGDVVLESGSNIPIVGRADYSTSDHLELLYNTVFSRQISASVLV